MLKLIDWLMRDEQEDIYELVFANIVNCLFVGLAALALWPAGMAGLAWRMAKGYWLFWVVLSWAALLLLALQRPFRVSLYERSDAYMVSCAAVSGVVQAGWSAFAALTLRDYTPGSTLLGAAALYFLGALSCWVAFVVVSAFYTGQLYRMINLPLALVAFAVFGVWPAAARALYGWFFDFF